MELTPSLMQHYSASYKVLSDRDINAPNFFTTLQKKKEIDAPNSSYLLVDGQLLIHVADAVSPSIRYLWVNLGGPGSCAV